MPKEYNTKADITKLIKSVIDDIKKDDNFYNSNAFKKKVKEYNDDYTSSEFKKAVKSITADSLEDLYRSLWVKRAFWKTDIK